jgi:hypothetical protein
MISGFLVVLADARNRVTGELYAGVGRMPPYPSDNTLEERGMDEYIFGGLKDPDTNVIPSLDAAARLCEMLSGGGRRFEIIYCRDADQASPGLAGMEWLGWDVATIRTECWSLAEDFSQGDWALPYRYRLNADGLFSERADAEAYLCDYRAHGGPDADFPFDVIEIFRVRTR